MLTAYNERQLPAINNQLSLSLAMHGFCVYHMQYMSWAHLSSQLVQAVSPNHLDLTTGVIVLGIAEEGDK